MGMWGCVSMGVWVSVWQKYALRTTHYASTYRWNMP
jgi:hypothetical protein